MGKTEQTRSILKKHIEKYPELQIRDVFKFLHQSSFGCEHLVSDLQAVREYIYEESINGNTCEPELVEKLDGDYSRVHLSYLKKGLSVDTLANLFMLSAEHVEEGKKNLEEKLAVLIEMVKEHMMPFTVEETEKAIKEWKEEGYSARRHSEAFRNAYKPSYRVIKNEYAAFLPLLSKIDSMLKEGQVNLAIEGGSASGKSTLGNLLEQIYDCTMFHMDDFFLRPEQRTEERFSEPGGNVDRERFLEEVLLPLSRNETINYRCFDCSTFSIKEPAVMKVKKLNVTEGAYSMHPDLEKYYNLSVFLDVSQELQRERIYKRNSPEMAERFFNEWIPMEHNYFNHMKVKDRCDIVIKI